MADDGLLALYSDWLMSAFGQTTATGLSALLDGQIRHDHIRIALTSDARSCLDEMIL